MTCSAGAAKDGGDVRGDRQSHRRIAIAGSARLLQMTGLGKRHGGLGDPVLLLRAPDW